MALIKIDELRPASSEFFADAEGFISELTAEELTISGGFGVADAVGGIAGVAVGTAQVGLVNTGDINVLNNSPINVLGNQNNGVIGWGCGCYHPHC